jgi:hypothetical protein
MQPSTSAMQQGDTLLLTTQALGANGVVPATQVSCESESPLLPLSSSAGTFRFVYPVQSAIESIAITRITCSAGTGVNLFLKAIGLQLIPSTAATIVAEALSVAEDATAQMALEYRDRHGRPLVSPFGVLDAIAANESVARVTLAEKSRIVVRGMLSGSTSVRLSLSSSVAPTIQREVPILVTLAPVAEIRFSEFFPSANVGNGVALSATAVTSSGRVDSGRTFLWESLDATTARVSASASGTVQLTAVAAGDAWIVASTGARRDSVRFTSRFVGSDSIAPRLFGATVTPSTIRVIDKPDSAIYHLDLGDEQSSMRTVLMSLSREAGGGGPACLAARVSGNDRRGIWRCAILFPQGSALGTYTPLVQTGDRVGNGATFRVGLDVSDLLRGVRVTLVP